MPPTVDSRWSPGTGGLTRLGSFNAPRREEPGPVRPPIALSPTSSELLALVVKNPVRCSRYARSLRPLLNEVPSRGVPTSEIDSRYRLHGLGIRVLKETPLSDRL